MLCMHVADGRSSCITTREVYWHNYTFVVLPELSQRNRTKYHIVQMINSLGDIVKITRVYLRNYQLHYTYLRHKTFTLSTIYTVCR